MRVVFLLNVPISSWAIFQMSFCAIKTIVISTYGYNIVNLFQAAFPCVAFYYKQTIYEEHGIFETSKT